jgi:hypothetical protein|tara:strand:- start:54 stop:323 length:270 start_codon:yes stop_codon:yes gene_type:complete
MAEKPIFTTPGGKKIMTLSAAKAYYESKRNPSKKGAKTFTQFIKEMKSKNKLKLPKFPKRKNKPKLPGKKPLAGTGFIRGSKKGKPKSK